VKIFWLIAAMSWISMFAIVWLGLFGQLDEARNLGFAITFFTVMAGASAFGLAGDDERQRKRNE
jgi:hypothetical protein